MVLGSEFRGAGGTQLVANSRWEVISRLLKNIGTDGDSSPGDRVVWSAGSYQWSAISSASPFTTETWCLIFDMSFWKFEATIKEWNFWRPRSSWRLWSRVEENSQTHRPPPPSATRWLPRRVVWFHLSFHRAVVTL